MESKKIEELIRLVQDTLANKDGLTNKQKDQPTAAAKDADLRAVEEVLARKIYDDLLTYPYGYGYTYPVTYDTIAGINALKAYHDLVLAYDYANGINYGYYYPIYQYIPLLYGLTIDNNGRFTTDAVKDLKKDTPAPAKTADKTNVQIGEQGVPVLVDPVLIKDKMKEADLEQREYIIDGVSGIGFLQQKSENVPKDLTVLQVNGEAVNVLQDDEGMYVQLNNPVVNPPFNNWSVNQPSPPHQRGLEGKADLGQNILVDGHPVHFAQIEK
jgi:hypothetical protein